MDNKIIHIPISYKQRKLNQMGEGYVPCEVSSRWIQFPKEANENYIPIDIMTIGENEKPKKICEMIVSKENLIKAINSIKFTNKE